MNEVPVFKRDNIIVTKTLARFGEVSYPINGIGSVFMKRPSFEQYVIYLATGFFLIVIGITSGFDKGGWFFFVVGATIMALSLTLRTKLVLRTASGDQQAYEARDAEAVSEVKLAIERAVAMRG